MLTLYHQTKMMESDHATYTTAQKSVNNKNRHKRWQPHGLLKPH